MIELSGEYHEDVHKLIQMHDNMTFHCGELREELIQNMRHCGCDHPHCNMCKDEASARALLDRHPEDYLGLLKADLLRKAATWATHPSGTVSVKRLLDEADKLEGK